MTLIVRPSLLRQTCIAASARRALSTRGPTVALRAASSKPTQSLTTRLNNPIPKQLASRYNRVAAFHASGRQLILPPEPQRIDGTANEPTTFPDPSPTHGSYHWTFERLVAAGLIPLTIAPFAAGSLNPTTDALLCATLLIHSHIGFESVLVDYLPQRRVPKTRAVFWWGLRATTVLVGIGLYEFETNDVGLTEAIKRIWTA